MSSSTQTPRASSQRDLTSGSLTRTLLRLAWPMAVGSAFQALYNMVDSFWLGRLDKNALGAPGVCLPLVFMVIAFGMGFGSAGTALVSQHTGAGRPRDAGRAAAQTILLLTVLCAAFSAPISIFATDLLRLARVPDDVLVHASGYLRIYALSLPFTIFAIAYGSVLRAVGDTLTMVYVGLATNVLNAVLDPLLIFGAGPVPAMGAEGAALATLLSVLLGALICARLLSKQHAGLNLSRTDFRPARAILGQIWRVGLPAGLSNSSNALGFATMQVIINMLGATVIAAFSVGSRISNLFDIPGFAVAAATTPIVGQALGAGKPQLADRAVRRSVTLIALGMLPPYALLVWQGSAVARIFTDSPEVIREAQWFFFVVPASRYCFTVMSALAAAFQGSGHNKPWLILSVVRQWLLRLPVCYLLGIVLTWGSTGVYIGFVIGNILSALMALWLFHVVDWRQPIVKAREAVKEDGADATTKAALPQPTGTPE